jgi:perosamine synthetase
LVENNRVTMERLLARGIEAVDFWRDFHPACNAREFPEAAKLRSSIVEIPCHQDLSLETMAKIVNVVRDVISGKNASPTRRSDQGLTTKPNPASDKSQQARTAAGYAV